MSDTAVPPLTADVVVLGTGPGGMAAVAAAAAEDADVIAVEALEHIGGNSVWSTGYLAFVNPTMQAEHGITDDEDVFVRDAAHMVELPGTTSASSGTRTSSACSPARAPRPNGDSEGALVATAGGHTGHFPVRLAGARADEPRLRDLPPTVGRDEVPELASDATTLPFARLVRHPAAALREDAPAAAVEAADLPTFADGLSLLRLTDAVDGGHPTAAP